MLKTRKGDSAFVCKTLSPIIFMIMTEQYLLKSFCTYFLTDSRTDQAPNTAQFPQILNKVHPLVDMRVVLLRVISAQTHALT